MAKNDDMEFKAYVQRIDDANKATAKREDELASKVKADTESVGNTVYGKALEDAVAKGNSAKAARDEQYNAAVRNAQKDKLTEKTGARVEKPAVTPVVAPALKTSKPMSTITQIEDRNRRMKDASDGEEDDFESKRQTWNTGRPR